MLLKTETDFTTKVSTGLKHRKICLDFRKENLLLGVHKNYFIFVYCNKVTRKLNFCNIEEFLQIIEKLLPLSNIVVIHVTSAPVDFLRALDKKCESLPSNILFTNIQEIEDVIESYLLMNEISYNTVNDNMITLLRIAEEIPKKFKKFEAQNRFERLIILIILLLHLFLLAYTNFYDHLKYFITIG
ncbi:3882_t:CDS:2 [Gigaspora margarita]|uniref:3882_t:CDS:1 n=1 Tax=Gigaspora margarita TaxID=4874 RepID=A0ABM8W0H7_GIGMA|nr:3882_t:CDS:2 [Gigaspora margarita]